MNDEKKVMIIAYGSKNVTLNQGNNHIILDKEDAKFLLNSLLKNLPFEIK